MSKIDPLTIKIMEKEYRIGCPEEEKDNLRASADLLNEKIDEIRQQGSVIGTERIIVMTALNMSHEILHNQSISTEHNDLNERIDEISKHITESMSDIPLI